MEFTLNILSPNKILYHGSSSKFDKPEVSPFWLTDRIEYAKRFTTTPGCAIDVNEDGYVYFCKANVNKPFDMGFAGECVTDSPNNEYMWSWDYDDASLDAYIKDPNNLTDEENLINPKINDYAEELGVTNKELVAFVGDDACVYDLCYSKKFIDLLVSKGYDSVLQRELNGRTLGVIDLSKVEIVDVKQVKDLKESRKSVVNRRSSKLKEAEVKMVDYKGEPHRLYKNKDRYFVKDKEYEPVKPTDVNPNKDLPDETKFYAYKQFKTLYNPEDPKTEKYKGILYPLYVGAKENDGIKVGQWYNCGEGELRVEVNENGVPVEGGLIQVDSKLGNLAYRPGWHMASAPVTRHIGVGKSRSKDNHNDYDAMYSQNVWALVEYSAKYDYSEKAKQQPGADMDAKKAMFTDKQDFENGYYKFKTNSNANDDEVWLIAYSMKVVKVLTDEEVERIANEHGLKAQKRWVADGTKGNEFVVDFSQFKVNESFKRLKEDRAKNLEKNLCQDKDAPIQEDIEKHDTLNPKLFDENNHLKPEVHDKVLEIANEFVKGLEEDGIKIKVKDVKLVGSNCSYNYNKDSDLDVHIVADMKDLECPPEMLMLLYSAYRSIWNNKVDIDFYGIPVELYVETVEDEINVDEEPLDVSLGEAKQEGAVKSNGVYSVLKDKWIKEPVQADIPDIDMEAFEELFTKWEDKYFDVIESASIKNIEDYIEDIYELRKSTIANDGEYGLGNLVFKEARALGYLDHLKDLKNELKSDELSLK